jgi:hypothetical protein
MIRDTALAARAALVRLSGLQRVPEIVEVLCLIVMT